MATKEAKRIGAIAPFGEKYGNLVRVVSMGTPIGKYTPNSRKNTGNRYCSIEFCGGTHVKRTGDIGFFKIVKIESIAAGVKRIEARTGIEAMMYVQSEEIIINGLANTLKTSRDRFSDRINYILNENRNLKEKLTMSEEYTIVDEMFDERTVRGVKIFFRDFRNIFDDVNAMKRQVLIQKNSEGRNSIIFACCQCKKAEKNVLVVAVTDDIVGKYSAVEMLRKLDSNGGGVQSFAMGSIGKKLTMERVVEKIFF
jgi:alanyl-tRNA synthetase